MWVEVVGRVFHQNQFSVPLQWREFRSQKFFSSTLLRNALCIGPQRFCNDWLGVSLIDSMNGGKLLTANLIFSSEAISCLCCSSRDTVSFSWLSGGLSLKKAAFVHPCGVYPAPPLTKSCLARNLCCGHTVYWIGR